MTDLTGLELLRQIEEGVAGKSGDAFFRQIVRDLTLALRAHAAFTSRLLPGQRAQMLAFWVDGRYEKCNVYSLAGTPCEFVYQGKITAHARDIGSIFPVDGGWFEELGVHSYLGVPIVAESGEVHGHLAVMDKPERDWREADVDILRLFSLRTAVELERAKVHRTLEETNESLRRMNEQLEHEIEQRAAMEKELASAKLAAEAANQAKSSFISQMSHELRTPLNGILGYAQLLRRASSSLNEQQREGLEIIERSGEHLLTLVNDLLDLAKIEAGKLELRAESFDLPALLQHVTELTQIRADKAGLRFHCELPTMLPRRLCGDARAVRQVLLNLLGNAVKFTNHGGSIALRVCSEATPVGDSHLRLEVADSGVGIAADQLQRIFEPFHRVDNPSRRAEGTGLGLAITRRLVEAMRGRISVSSAPAVGTTFRVELDLGQAEAEVATAPEGRQVIGYNGRRLGVVIADDDCVSRTLIADLLTGLGFQVVQVGDGRAALQSMVDDSPLGGTSLAVVPDLLITDLVMPLVDGIELTRSLRARQPTAHLPILALSSSASDHTGREALGAGCNAFLPKPVRLEALLERVGTLLSLEWCYAAQQPHSSLPSACETDFALERGIADELRHLAMLGDIQGLTDRATQLLQSNPAAAAFCHQLRSLADQYDTAAIRRMLSSQPT